MNESGELEKLKSVIYILRWLAAGCALLLIGVTQAAFGWIGSSWWMRILYSLACIVSGIVILVFVTRELKANMRDDSILGDKYASEDPYCPNCGEELVSYITRRCKKCGAEF